MRFYEVTLCNKHATVLMLESIIGEIGPYMLRDGGFVAYVETTVTVDGDVCSYRLTSEQLSRILMQQPIGDVEMPSVIGRMFPREVSDG